MKAALVVAVIISGQPLAASNEPMLTCHQLRQVESRPSVCRNTMLTEANHPWSGLDSSEEARNWIAQQCAPDERVRDNARHQFLSRNREAIARLAPWFDPDTAGDGDWSGLFFGRSPTVCERINSAQDR